MNYFLTYPKPYVIKNILTWNSCPKASNLKADKTGPFLVLAVHKSLLASEKVKLVIVGEYHSPNDSVVNDQTQEVLL